MYLDDILVTGPNEEEHLQNLQRVLQRLEEHGLKLKRGKCQFLQPRVDYLGYGIDKDGLHAMPIKVAAIVESPNTRKCART